MKRFHSIVFAALLVVLVSSPSQALVISFQPSATTVDLGDLFDIDILVSGLDVEIVSAYDLDVNYDPTIVNATGVSFGPFLGLPFDSLTDFILTSGNVNLAELSFLSDADLDSLQGDAFVLATISFRAVGVGTTDLIFRPSEVFNEIDIKGRSGLIHERIEPQNGQVTVRGTTPVPEPGTLLLALSLLGLLGARRRTRA